MEGNTIISQGIVMYMYMYYVTDVIHVHEHACCNIYN